MDLKAVIPAEFMNDTIFKDNPAYYFKDGLYYCSECNTPVQCRPPHCDEIVTCLCKCEQERLEKEKQERIYQQRMRQRKECFSCSPQINYTFENSKFNPDIMAKLKSYCDRFLTYFENKQNSSFNGLLAWGKTGGGKSYASCCIANELIMQGFNVAFTSFTKLERLKFENRELYYRQIEKPALLIVDDLGVERKSPYMQEIVYEVANTRYESSLPMVITTNLTLKELQNSTDTEQRRIYDRILERCYPIEFNDNVRQKVIGGK